MTPFSILIVDDNEDDRYILKRQLRDSKLPISKVFEACDGVNAVEFFEDGEQHAAMSDEVYPPKFIFLDINMPLMGGFEFLKVFEGVVKKLSLDSIIIVMFSSSEREQDRKMALSYSQVKGYFIKGAYGVDNLTEQLTLMVDSNS
ncbi:MULTISPECIES: response regulator [Pseudoalteromonas]|uniref:CheY-like receiver n=1 Tax=Pseudoalteromonas luteoviolacea (strain 2ta16) TaxID=1353533 RepID=V4J5T1_PSEL2|nr:MULTISPECIES: response regulator [Pseudoalteromonas]ESP90697.1 CheY-like receiver [Pseudoalteromonas luteoviolacea 2ta16]KZN41728.1 hypothetical protein N483_13745 [Pseudoalteromonas luteoviolacea NCIMB 1944]MCG7548112.1 response regulator [Pseudoalteromonas sp. Of7M-16]